jgi:Sigma-70, region 4
VDELDEALAAHSNPTDIAEQRDEFDRLVIAMCALPEAQRQALVKRELEGVGHGEIAAHLGTTATAVRGLIFRARTQLRNAVGALVPIPVLRAMLAQGTAASGAGAAGGMAGGAGSAALLGGAGAKGGAVLAAAILAIGSGIALEKRHRGHGDVESASAAEPNGSGAATRRSGSRLDHSAPAAADRGNPNRDPNGPVSTGNGKSSGAGQTSSDGHHPSGSGGGSGSGSSGSSGSGDDHHPSGGSDGGGSDSSGPGSGHEVDDDPPSSPESGDDSSDSNDHTSTEVEAPEDDSSGPGSGKDDSPESDDGGHFVPSA